MRAYIFFIFSFLVVTEEIFAREGVILLHGLCRSSKSMEKMEKELSEAGYLVRNVSYPSRQKSIHELAETAIGTTLNDVEIKSCSKVHFVTHSMGGILVRSYLNEHRVNQLGRVVMLAPPNKGSEVVDKLGSWALFRWMNGPAGQELRTDETSTPNELGEIKFECGVLTGDRSINWINSIIIPGKDDGKVSVERSKISGVKEHKVLHVTHPFIMKNDVAIDEVLYFLRSGAFSKN